MELKKRFCSKPILITPNPTLPFIVEVDAAELRVGPILSQRSPQDQKVHGHWKWMDFRQLTKKIAHSVKTGLESSNIEAIIYHNMQTPH